MGRTTQKRQQKISFVLSIISYIKELGRLPNEKRFNLTKSGLTYWTRKLISLGILRKTDKTAATYRVLKSDEEIKTILKKIYTKKVFVTTKKKYANLRYKRLHNIQYKVTLPKFDYWLDVMAVYLEKKGLEFTINKKNQFRVILEYKGLNYVFLLCRNSIIGYLPSGKDFIGDDSLLLLDIAKSYIREVLDYFSKCFGRDLRIKGDFVFSITRHHIALMNNELAKSLHKDKREIKVYIDGVLRVITDKSFNWDELEAVTRKRGVSDVEAMENLISDVITNKYTIGDVKLSLEEKLIRQEAIIEKMINNQDKLLQYLQSKDNSNAFSQFR